MEPDNIDLRIVRALQADGRLSNVELAKLVNLSESSCLRRTRALERAGVIRAYRAVIDHAALGFSLTAYVLVNLDQRLETDESRFLSLVQSDERVLSCTAITGAFDFVLHVRLRDIDDLGDLTMHKLLRLGCVRSLTTCVAMRVNKSME